MLAFHFLVCEPIPLSSSLSRLMGETDEGFLGAIGARLGLCPAGIWKVRGL